MLESGRSDFTDRWTSGLSWKGASPEGDFRPLYILNFVLSTANENRSSTGVVGIHNVNTHMTSDDVIISGVDSIVLLGDGDVHVR